MSIHNFYIFEENINNQLKYYKYEASDTDFVRLQQ